MPTLLPTAGRPTGAGLNETVTGMAAFSPDPAPSSRPLLTVSHSGCPHCPWTQLPHRLILLGSPTRLPRHPPPASLWSFQPQGHLTAGPGLSTQRNVAAPASVRPVYVSVILQVSITISSVSVGPFSVSWWSNKAMVPCIMGQRWSKM